MNLIFSPDVFALGLAVGVLGLVLILSLIVSYAYNERTLRLLAAYLAGMSALAAIGETLPLPQNLLQAILLIAGPSLTAALVMLLLKNRHVGKADKIVMAVIGCITVALMILFVVDQAALSVVGDGGISLTACLIWFVLLVGASVYLALQSWESVGPWKWWLVLGHSAGLLVSMTFLLHLVNARQSFWPIVLMLVVQLPPIYLSLVWRSRLINEIRLRGAAANVVDPLTGLATTSVLIERLMRITSQNSQGKNGPASSALYLIQVQNWNGLLAELGPEFNEKLSLEAALRLRRSIGDNDLVARIEGNRFAVVAQGMADTQEIGVLATRLVVSGLRIDSPLLPGVELQFRVMVRPLKFARPLPLPAVKEWLAMLVLRFQSWPSTHRSRSILVVTDEPGKIDFPASS